MTAALTIAAKSLILRILWAGWAIGAGRYPTREDMRNKALIKSMNSKADEYLPDTRRVAQKIVKQTRHSAAGRE